MLKSPTGLFSGTLFTGSGIAIASLGAYAVLSRLLGFDYGLYVASAIVFTGISAGFIVGSPDGYKGAPEAAALAPRPLVSPKVLFAGLAALVLAEELLLDSVYSSAGLTVALVSMITLPLIAPVVANGNRAARISVEAMALVFATRVVVAPFPLGYFNVASYIPVVYALVLTGTIAYLTFRKVSAREVRLVRGKGNLALVLGAGVGIGTLMGVVEHFILHPGSILGTSNLFENLLYLSVVMVVFVAVTEELLFRGVLMGSLGQMMPPWQAICFSSVIFGQMHLGWFSPLEVIFAYSAGVVFGYFAYRTDSLLGPIVAHGLDNIVLFLLGIV
ncbi:MAG: CPBP family intramembrane metalloprotease [Nitrososphaerota archaeon]|nr:CPBP family intramembrane metalloprotease [Nitrososphaerota archaeon]